MTPDRIDEPTPHRAGAGPGEDLASALAGLDRAFGHGTYFVDDRLAALCDAVRALARRVEEVAAAVRRRDQQEADDGR